MAHEQICKSQCRSSDLCDVKRVLLSVMSRSHLGLSIKDVRTSEYAQSDSPSFFSFLV